MINQIEIPTTCPSCLSVLELVNSQLFCRSKDCPAQSTKKVEAFVKKLRIKGLGPVSISKLGFVHPIEIYKTSLETYVEVLGKKIGQKLYDEVQKSRTTTFVKFLSALSIPLIGDTASKKIGYEYNSIQEIIDNDPLHNIVGPLALDNLIEFIFDNINSLTELENYFTFINQSIAVTPGSKGNVCITGKLNDFSNRNKAKESLEFYGYAVTTGVSGKTDYLVCEDGSTSSKTKKAESLKIPIVTIDNLIKGIKL